MTILIISHMGVLAEVADRTIRIEDGRLVKAP